MWCSAIGYNLAHLLDSRAHSNLIHYVVADSLLRDLVGEFGFSIRCVLLGKAINCCCGDLICIDSLRFVHCRRGARTMCLDCVAAF